MTTSGSSADQMTSALEKAVATLRMSAEDIIPNTHSYREKQKEVRVSCLFEVVAKVEKNSFFRDLK